MKKKGNLYELIYSLDKAERKHFLVNSHRIRNSKYMRLFEFIVNNNHVDDECVRGYFRGERFLNQLHVVKNYLYNRILDSLRENHSAATINIRIKNHIISAEVLFKKELYHQCYYELKKAKNLASKFERTIDLLEILKMEKALIQSPLTDKGNLPAISNIISEEHQQIRSMSIYNQYLDISYNVLSDGYQPSSSSEILKSKILERNIDNDPLLTKIMHHHIAYVFHTFQGNTEEGINQIRQLTEVIESHPHRIADDPKPYITAINNQIGALLYLRKHTEIQDLLIKIRQIPDKYKLPLDSYLRRSLARSYNMELELYRDTLEIDKGLDLIPKTIGFLEDNIDLLPEEYIINLYYQFAYLNFLAGNHATALQFTNEIIGRNFGAIREDMQGFARLLNLILHYELKNIIVLKYAVLSTRRFLQKKKEMHLYEQNLLKFCSRLCTTPIADHRRLFGEAKETVFKHTKPSELDSILDYLDFNRWFSMHD